MSMRSLLESIDNINNAPINEGTTKVQTIGNNVEVTDETGQKTQYDKDTWAEMNKQEESIEEGFGDYDDFEGADAEVDDNLFSDPDFDSGTGFDLDDDDIGLDFEMEGYGDTEGEMDSDFESPDSEVNDDLFNDPDFDSGSDYDLGDDDIGMDFALEGLADDETEEAFPGDTSYEDDFDDDDFDEPEYTPFNAEEQSKRLRAGTPIVFDDSIGGGTGTFIEKSPSGFFGTAERKGKSISIHLSDIVAADLVNDNIYETFDYQFGEAMEDYQDSVPTPEEEPEAEIKTVTVTAEIPIDQLADIMKLSGLADNQEEVYKEVPTGEEPAEDESEAEDPSMSDMMSTVDDAEEETNEGNEDYEDGKDFDSKQKSGYQGDNDDDDNDDENEFELDQSEPKVQSAPDDDEDKENEFEMGGDKKEEVDEEYSNEPDEKIASADTQLNGMAGGLNKPKRQVRKAHPLGDNPLKENSADSFLNLYKAIKTIDES